MTLQGVLEGRGGGGQGDASEVRSIVFIHCTRVAQIEMQVANCADSFACLFCTPDTHKVGSDGSELGQCLYKHQLYAH